MIEWLWEGFYQLFRILVVLTIISAIGGAVNALWEKFADPKHTRQKKRQDWRDDFR